MTVPVAMIAAVGENCVIGAANALPWKLPTDFKFFKQTTLGKPLIMGRKTFESIGKPLPGRTSLVVSRSIDALEGAIVVDSVDAALERGQQIAAAEGAAEVMIGGGAAIYAAALPLTDRLYITHVAASPDGDAFFPPIDPSIWTVIEALPIVPGERDSAGFTVRVYERR